MSVAPFRCDNVQGRAVQALVLCCVLAPGCSKHRAGEPSSGATASTADVAATIAIDGSSTVFPINEAVAEEFQKKHESRVTIGVSGTGGGFKKFCNKETAITGASRPIKPSEVQLCKGNAVEYIELPVAYDGIAVVVHPDASWIDAIKVEELQRLWRPEAQKTLTRWNQLRPQWPDEEIRLFGPGVDSGTYDYFTKAIVGKEHSSRGDFTSSEDDNVLVQGIATDVQALGYFGYAYYAENKNRLKVVPVDDGKDDNGKGPIAPSATTVADGTYQPLSRPIFIYVSKQAADRPGVQRFIGFYLANAPELVEEVGYIPLPGRAYRLVATRFEKRVTGSLFAGHGSRVGVTVEELLAGN
ncbi:MAG: PstS family phosphate ABC transporter substrate-binding protein [Proteobacteria bacterium]|nr:PstS family phosphate ABC transporter substrate-binding protein [Pseudomonadota bacterium]